MPKATQKRFIIVLVNQRTRKPIIDQYHFSLKIQNKRNLSAEHLSRVWLFVDGQLAAHYSNLRISEAAKVTTTREWERWRQWARRRRRQHVVAPHSAGARTASTLRPDYWDRLVLEEFWRTVVECNEMLISSLLIEYFLSLLYRHYPIHFHAVHILPLNYTHDPTPLFW